MVIFREAEALRLHLRQRTSEGETIGFVPTMGALHQGHISLISTAGKENSLTVCSIFVNPTQFNNAEDFRLYPVSVESDIALLIAAGCQLLFLPSVSEIYPPSFQKRHYELGPIGGRLEGLHRPGHFQGVCQVVDRLLDIVEPQHLYLGQKDMQQCIVIKQLLALTGRKDTSLRIVETMREDDGLAMSSRNRRLDESQRRSAPAIFKTLQFLKLNLRKNSFSALKEEAKLQLEEAGFEVDYVEIADAADLAPAKPGTEKIVGLIAASTGNVRLIDNMPLN